MAKSLTLTPRPTTGLLPATPRKLAPRPNPITERKVKTCKPHEFSAPHVLRDEQSKPLDPVRLFRRQKAEEFIGQLRPGVHLFGFSKGQFSLVDVIRELSNQLGPSAMALSTWTVAKADLTELEDMVKGDRFCAVRFLLDFSFQRRQPALIHHIREKFGPGAVVVTLNHAKFLLFKNAAYSLVVRTSMNLNFNPRLEDIEIKDDPHLYAFIEAILDELFESKDPQGQTGKSWKEINADLERFAQ